MNKRWLIFRKVDDINKEPYYLFDKEQVQHYYGTKEEYCFNFKDEKGENGVLNIVNCRNYWTDVNMKCYDNIIYAPCYDGVLAAEYFNTWEGWNVMKYKVCKDYSKCDVILKHLKEVWCSDDEVLYKWFLEYLSVIVRGGRTCVVPIVRGTQKCGKDSFMTDLLMNRMLGLKYCLTTNDPINQVFGRFNNALLNMSLVVMAEGDYALNTCYDRFKDLITNAVLRLEGKFADIVSATNYTNFIISTNKYDIIKGDKGMDDRRLLYVNCSDKYLGNKTYFDNLYKNGINDDEAVSAFYHYLTDKDMVYQVPLDDLSYLQENKPITKLTKDLKEKNTPITSQFIYEYFKMDVLEGYITSGKSVSVKRTELYAKYKTFVEFNGFERLKMDLFSAHLLNYTKIECKRHSTGYYYIFTPDVLSKLKVKIDEMIGEGDDMMDDTIIHTDKPSWEDDN
jgi:phage/plasmid-associated DNA primase